MHQREGYMVSIFKNIMEKEMKLALFLVGLLGIFYFLTVVKYSEEMYTNYPQSYLSDTRLICFE